MKIFIRLLSIIWLFPSYIWASGCDDPSAAEEVRYYYANGMFNKLDAVQASQKEVAELMGVPLSSVGRAYNFSEDFITQLLQVARQRRNSSDEFWYWLRNLNEAPQYFKDEYKRRVGRFNDSIVNNDSNLQTHIQQYLGDLRAGKKVVIVAHSQGNFYANNALHWIRINEPRFLNSRQKSIGIVGVATPASLYAHEATFYTTNAEDLVINLVRSIYRDTPPPSPSRGIDITRSDHEFIESYLHPRAFRSRIKNHIIQTERSLTEPLNECEPVVITRGSPAASSGSYYFYLYAKINRGSYVSWWYQRRGDGSYPGSCSRYAHLFPDGNLDGPSAGDTIRTSNLHNDHGILYGVRYQYRFCAKNLDGDVFQSPVYAFIRNR